LLQRQTPLLQQQIMVLQPHVQTSGAHSMLQQYMSLVHQQTVVLQTPIVMQPHVPRPEAHPLLQLAAPSIRDGLDSSGGVTRLIRWLYRVSYHVLQRVAVSCGGLQSVAV